MLAPRNIPRTFYEALYNTIHHDGIEHAGYLAFLGLLAFFPFLVFIVAIAGFLGEGQIGADFVSLLFRNLPQSIVTALQPRVEEILSGPPQGLLTVAILGAVWTASSAVEGYRTVLNRAYRVNTPPAYIWRRMLSIVQLIIFAFLIIVAMLVLVLMPIILQRIELLVGFSVANQLDEAWAGLVLLISVLAFLLAVAGMYYILPNIKQKFLSVLPGAVLVVVLWVAAAYLLSFYLSNFRQVNLIYGSLGGIIAALLFFYINNIILIYGAELNYLLKKAAGERIEQKEATTAPPPED